MGGAAREGDGAEALSCCTYMPCRALTLTSREAALARRCRGWTQRLQKWAHLKYRILALKDDLVFGRLKNRSPLRMYVECAGSSSIAHTHASGACTHDGWNSRELMRRVHAPVTCNAVGGSQHVRVHGAVWEDGCEFSQNQNTMLPWKRARMTT